jgi:hypothetical protein
MSSAASTGQRLHHLILTRFNVRLGADDPSPRGLSPAWLTDRIALFERFTVASVANQTDRRFDWLVLFDSRTPEPFRTAIMQLSVRTPFTPIWLEGTLGEYEGCSDEVKQAIVARVPDGVTHLATTRLDNDDGIAATFMADIRACFSGRVEAIVFPLGYQLTREGLLIDYSRGNHFISLIEAWDVQRLMTIFVRTHDKLYEVVPVRQVYRAPAWLEVVHGGNIANRPKGGLPVSPARLTAEFGIAPDDVLLGPRQTRLTLLAQQVKFLTVGAPRYVIAKAMDRWRHHGARLG